jgi:hypothetical protein
MTATELQKQVKAALAKLNVPVTKDFSEYEDIYPHVVYREISNVPALSGDNHEIAFRSVYQVTIVTNNDDYEELESAVESAMLDLGFMRTAAQDILDENFNRVLRFTVVKQKIRGE